MKTLLGISLVALLAGCAVPPQHTGYGSRVGAQPRDPSQWRVVSVTPVPAGTAARVASTSRDGKPVEYSTNSVPQLIYNPAPAYGYSPGNAPVYAPAPVYGHAPVYSHGPVYAPAPTYYWPPVTLSLGFIFGRHWSRGHGGAHFRGGRRW